MKPYYQDDAVTIYHGDCREILPKIPRGEMHVLVTDPPFGINYYTQRPRLNTSARDIQYDEDLGVRDAILAFWRFRPALVFGSWKQSPPAETRAALVWDQGGALGMGALDLPWKPSWQMIYVLGHGFEGARDEGSVLRCSPVQSMFSNGRTHPNEKPVELLERLLVKCPPGTVVDPFMGTGSTLVAAKALGRWAIGIEIEERYCEIAAKRCAQEVLEFGAYELTDRGPVAISPEQLATKLDQP